eukprot:2418675-Prymnesium_polylepis.2
MACSPCSECEPSLVRMVMPSPPGPAPFVASMLHREARERMSATKRRREPSFDHCSEPGEWSKCVSASRRVRVSPLVRSWSMIPTASLSYCAPAIVSHASFVPSGEKVGVVS